MPRPRVIRGSKYRGVEPRVPAEDKTDIRYEGPGSVECRSCGASVMSLPSNPFRPRAHSPGGYTTNTRAGRYKCPGSGNDGTTYAS